jgi:hypothetical protein
MLYSHPLSVCLSVCLSVFPSLSYLGSESTCDTQTPELKFSPDEVSDVGLKHWTQVKVDLSTSEPKRLRN